MKKIVAAASPFVVMLALGVGLTGCASDQPVTTPAPHSPDAAQKDPTKTPAGTPGAMAPAPTTPTVTTPNPKAMSPDIAAKDPSKTAAPESGGMAAMMKYKDATHELKTDSPYFKSMPSADAKPDGMWMAGTQVLVLVPGAPYTEVKNGAGADGYVPTANLKTVSK